MLRRRICWFAIAVASVLLLAAGAWYRFSTYHFQPWQFLSHVVQLEEAGVDPATVQPLGWSLAILGRDDEVRELNVFPQFQRPPSTFNADQLELANVPWKAGIEQIAANHRIVMIMEDHFASRHREFIGATLATFRRGGFTHYAAEAIGPLDTALSQRGYPTSRTGLYTADPRFGNTLRTALELEFKVLGYDFRPGSHAAREEYAATRLAELLRQDAKTKLIVHAGHAHVLKHKTTLGERWLAARLWQKTGIEPFTIWQWSSNHDARDYAEVVRVLTERGISLTEPVLLLPPPGNDLGLQDSPYGLASVDAIVLHPIDRSVAPDKRTVLFPNDMHRIDGRWTSNVWPVVISVYKHGEPVDAIPLDQVMLRQNETHFRLWTPTGVQYEIRVFNSNGELDSRVEVSSDPISVRLGSQP